MNSSYEFAGFEPEQVVHVVEGNDGHQSVYRAIVATAGPQLLELFLTWSGDTALPLPIGTHVHVVHPSGRWERARVTQSNPATGLSLEPAAPVAVLPARGHQRKYRRVTVQGLYGYASLVTPTAATRFRVQILDVSAGGVNMMAHRELQKGDDVRLQLPPLTPETPIEVAGRLAWSAGVCGSWMAGVQFVRLDEAALDRLQRFVFNLRWRSAAAAVGTRT